MKHSLHTVVYTTSTPLPPIQVEYAGQSRCEADLSDGSVCLTLLLAFDEHCPNQWQHWHGEETVR